MDEGSHGNVTAKDRQELNDCIACHDPHYQMPSSDPAGGNVDLTQTVEQRSGTRQEFQTKPPKPSAEDADCMACHRAVDPEDPQHAEKTARFCFNCHGSSVKKEWIQTFVNRALIDGAAYQSSTHANIPCTVCHINAAEFMHKDQRPGDCRRCHIRHDEKVTHDAHLRVTCEACHLKGIQPIKDAESGRILWRLNRSAAAFNAVHHMHLAGDEASCRRCHFDENMIGAAAMVLPPKSVMCMPCHGATFSISDTTTMTAVVIFFLGILSLASIWFSGSTGNNQDMSPVNKMGQLFTSAMGALFSTRLYAIIKTLILDALLQRRLFRRSRTRWMLHGVIFFPLMLRFGWGLVALAASLWAPRWSGTWSMIDKNHPVCAFLYDVTGLLMFSGIVLICLRKRRGRPNQQLSGLPKPDWAAFILLGGIIVVGFILEGMRITLTGNPQGAQYAFLGYFLGRFFTGTDLTGSYAYVWYIHAILTGAFVAYLPFSRLFHMIMAPIVLAMNTAPRHPDR